MTRNLGDFDLAAAMRTLYETSTYYISVPTDEAIYEENYWRKIF